VGAARDRLTAGGRGVVEAQDAGADVLPRGRAPEPRFVLHDRPAQLSTGVADVLNGVPAAAAPLPHVVGDVDGLALPELAEALVIRVVEAAEAGELVAAAARDEVDLHAGTLLRRVGAGRRDLDFLERVEVVVGRRRVAGRDVA